MKNIVECRRKPVYKTRKGRRQVGYLLIAIPAVSLLLSGTDITKLEIGLYPILILIGITLAILNRKKSDDKQEKESNDPNYPIPY